MLTALSVRNVVLIETLDLDLNSGLTALTGETGAGKSIILDALGMATGARSDRGLVRKGCNKAQCTAQFELPAGHIVRTILEAADLETDKGEPIVLRRTINSDGRSKAFINDVAVSVKLLGQIGSHLLEVHGQHDGRGLLDPLQHVLMLDSFGGFNELLALVKTAHRQMSVTEKELAELISASEKAAGERDFLIYALEELDRLDVKAGEEENIAARRRLLQASEGALSELKAASDALGAGDYETRIASALAGIERIRDKIGGDNDGPSALTEAAQALERALLETQEARCAVADAAQTFNADPGELDQTEQRLFAIKAACRKYGVTSAELSEKRREFADELALIDNSDAAIDAARKAAKAAKDSYDKAADKLTKKRETAAKKLAAAVAKELPDLKMERAVFRVDMESGPDTATGRDKIRFEVATNPGTAMGALDKVASGGELARFALAIKVALAGKHQNVMVFDEVDQGVGGAVASAVGRRLAKLSADGQVFVVTHSPQVAACADHQYRIEKSGSAKTTVTSVMRVSSEEREEEIARMLAGETVTDEARAAARQLMKPS